MHLISSHNNLTNSIPYAVLWHCASCRGSSCAQVCVCAHAADLHALDLQLHVVFSRRLSILPFLPAVSVLSVLHLLPVVQDDAAVLRPDTQTNQSINKNQQERGPQLCVWQVCSGSVPGFEGAGEPLVMSVEGYQVGSDFLQKQRRFTSFKITRRAQSELLLKTALQSTYGMKRFLLTLKKTFSDSKNFRRLSMSQ